MAQRANANLIDWLPWIGVGVQASLAWPATLFAFAQVFWVVDRLHPTLVFGIGPITSVLSDSTALKAIAVTLVTSLVAATLAAWMSVRLCDVLSFRRPLVFPVILLLGLSFALHPTLRALAWAQIAQTVPPVFGIDSTGGVVLVSAMATLALALCVVPIAAIPPILFGVSCVDRYWLAAANLGGTRNEFIHRVLRPYLRPILAISFAISLTFAVFDPFITRMVTGQLVPSVDSVFADYLSGNDWGRVSALSIVLSGFLLFVFILLSIGLRRLDRR